MASYPKGVIIHIYLNVGKCSAPVILLHILIYLYTKENNLNHHRRVHIVAENSVNPIFLQPDQFVFSLLN